MPSDNAIVLVATLAGVLILAFVILFIVGRGSLARLGLAWQAFTADIATPRRRSRIEAVLRPLPPEPSKPVNRRPSRCGC